MPGDDDASIQLTEYEPGIVTAQWVMTSDTTATTSFWVNGVFAGSLASTAYASQMSLFVLGAQDSGEIVEPSEPNAALFYEVMANLTEFLVYGGANKRIGDRRQVENYLGSKYDIQTPTMAEAYLCFMS